MISRRNLLRHAALTAVAGLGTRAIVSSVAEARAKGPQLIGSGRIGKNIAGVTLPSPSDFGFNASPAGGNFVCSMFGPQTGGFLGCDLMTVEGFITPGSLQIHRGRATFSGQLDIFMFPNIFLHPPSSYLNLAANDFTVTCTLGGPGKATMVLHIPNVTQPVGGDTGGVVEFGRIERRKNHT